jgi:hypothetical protein
MGMTQVIKDNWGKEFARFIIMGPYSYTSNHGSQYEFLYTEMLVTGQGKEVALHLFRSYIATLCSSLGEAVDVKK